MSDKTQDISKTGEISHKELEQMMRHHDTEPPRIVFEALDGDASTTGIIRITAETTDDGANREADAPARQ